MMVYFYICYSFLIETGLIYYSFITLLLLKTGLTLTKKILREKINKKEFIKTTCPKHF